MLLALPALLACNGPDDPDPDETGTTPTTPTTPTVPGCPVLDPVVVATSPNNSLERRLSVDLSGPEAVWALCTSPDDPEEQLLAESSSSAAAHELVVRGLRAGTSYACEVHVACGGPVRRVSFTPEGPPVPPFEVTKPDGASQPYTLLNTQQGAISPTGSWLLIVDPEGGVRWAYPVGTDLVGDLDAEVVDGGAAVHVGGGWGWFDEDLPHRGVFRDVDLSGETLLDRVAPDFGLGFNHHSEKLDDGSYLSLTGSENTDGVDTWYGVGIEHWHPTEGLRWTWSSQSLLDAGVLAPPPQPGTETPYHANSVSFVGDAWGDGVWVSLYAAREVWRLDHATGERTHVFGPNGDFTLVDAGGQPLGLEDWTYVQHDPDYGPDGKVLMYDNGQGRPVPEPYSRVVELQLDLDARTATVLWEWTEPGWYDPVLGDADYLPNGNVLVTKGFNLNWSPEGGDVSQVVELKPPDEVVWRLKWTSEEWPTFRAERYDGCLLFANGRYCEAVAERIAELDSRAE